jgi:hypothetical protein
MIIVVWESPLSLSLLLLVPPLVVIVLEVIDIPAIVPPFLKLLRLFCSVIAPFDEGELAEVINIVTLTELFTILKTAMLLILVEIEFAIAVRNAR